MKGTQTPGFESVWASITELDKNQREISRIAMKNAKLIGKLGRQKHPNTRRIIQQLETMCYL